MPALSRTQAVDTLSGELSRLSDDDLVEVYNELFPETPISDDTVPQRREFMVGQIADHVRGGLEAEEIVDLWNVLFPHYRSVWYDEGADLLHCDVEPTDDESGLAGVREE